MCELFGMSSRLPATINYSMMEFSRVGSGRRQNSDGFGFAFWDNKDARVIREPHPAHDSPWVKFLAEQDLRSRCAIAHIRAATRGENALRNTHPFERELGGRRHVFAHNGTMPNIAERLPFASDFCRPIGETDSEHAFCVLMQRLAASGLYADGLPDLEARLDLIAAFARDLRAIGPCNFLYCDGDALFAHGHRRHWFEENAVHPPGLHLLRRRYDRNSDTMDASGLTVTIEDYTAVLLASVPLTEDEEWEPLAEGTVLALKDGAEVKRIVP